MKPPKNSITLTLIFSSVMLLLVLQFFWLQKVYKDESESFYKETHALFREMIFQMNDSLLMKSVEPIRGDNSVHLFSNHDVDTIRFRKRNELRINDTLANVQVYISSSSGKDSMERYLKPLISQIKRDKNQKQFFIRLSPDSLHLTDIQNKFEKVLAAAEITAPFIIKRENPEIPFPPKRMSMGEDIIVTPTGDYKVEFPGVHYLIVKKISPQIFFSVFLTLLTVSSFLLLYRSLRMQQQLMQLKNEFIGNVTHELKTPIATVSVALEALKNFSAMDNPRLTEEYLDMAKRELDRLATMTDKILDASIFESKGIQFTPENTNLDFIIQDMMNTMKVVFEKRDAKVTYQKEGENFEIEGGVMHLTNFIYNLVDNALKYSTDKPVIDIRLQDEHDKVVLSIRDNGIGIAPEYQHKIFEKFFRIPSGNVHNSKGYGLGLNYVASVVKSHHGKIDVVSTPNEGSTFTITIPRASGNLLRKSIPTGIGKDAGADQPKT